MMSCFNTHFLHFCGFFLILQDVTALTKEEELVHHLLNSSVYNPKIRPVKRYNDVIHVRHALELKQLIKLDERNQVITTSALLKVKWKDEYLIWDPNKFYGIKGLNINIKHIWFPKIELFNSGEDGLSSMDIPSVYVTSDGNVDAVMPRIIESTCSIKVRDFPYDKQICQISFGSFQYEVKHMVMTPLGDSVNVDNFQTHAEWDLKQTSVSNSNVYHAFSVQRVFSGVSYQLELHRKPLYYVYNFIMPCLLIAIITVLLFVIPPQTGERMAVGVTILLSLAVFFLLLEQKMPETSDSVPLIGKYFACTIAEASLAVVAICYVLYLHHHDPVPVPPWMKKYILGHLARLLFIKTSINRRNSKEHGTRNESVKFGMEETQSQEVADMLGRKYVRLWRRNIAIAKENRQRDILLRGVRDLPKQPPDLSSSKRTITNSPETIITDIGDSDEEKEYCEIIEEQYAQTTRKIENKEVNSEKGGESCQTTVNPTKVMPNKADRSNARDRWEKWPDNFRSEKVSTVEKRNRKDTGQHVENNARAMFDECGDRGGKIRDGPSPLFQYVDINIMQLRKRNLSEAIAEVDEEMEGYGDQVKSIDQKDAPQSCESEKNNNKTDPKRPGSSPTKKAQQKKKTKNYYEEKEERNLKILADDVKEEMEQNALQAEWQMVAKVVNYFFMWLFIFSVALTFLTCFGPVMVQRENGIW